MKPNTVVVLVMLSGLLAAGGGIAHNYSKIHTARMAGAGAPPPPFPPYSAQMSQRFHAPGYPSTIQEQIEYVTLLKHAQDTHNLKEFNAIQLAHNQHLANSRGAFNLAVSCTPRRQKNDKRKSHSASASGLDLAVGAGQFHECLIPIR